MDNCWKCYEYWGTENGKPIIKKTNWFKWKSDDRSKWQLKPILRNFYKME